MIKRYEDSEIAMIWSDENKLNLWQKTELAVIKARVKLGYVSQEIFNKISKILLKTPIDLDWWKKRDNEIHHDLQAFIDERLRFLSIDLQRFLHERMTSYDTEEPAFSQMLKKSLSRVHDFFSELMQDIAKLALHYRYTIMNARTHGQEAELQSFGKRCLTWYRELQVDLDNLKRAEKNLCFSKLSGAVGNYGGIDPELEKEALKILGFKPFYGATQIIPRAVFAPIAQALAQIVSTLNKIAIDVRLGARSGRAICQEPFAKKQKGSSKMPHKKNTISTEQTEGMARMANKFFQMIMDNIPTWEERSIEQSCVERVAWPDLFHVVVRSIKVMTKILTGLRVYPDVMIQEIIESRGCYAAGEAKEVLRELGVEFGLTSEEAYRIIQLAAFNVFRSTKMAQEIRESPPTSLIEADSWFEKFKNTSPPPVDSIQEIIIEARIETSEDLEATDYDVQRWNSVLSKIFQNQENLLRWNQIFLPSYLLRNETRLFQEVLGAK
ncbi:hypothetical protein KKA23_03430 [Patescibacteria group bacterium]|nr:hypothetical protein [Patescibacteria group bacterium]MBU3923187.1 hypothetical protein [Patescibacteria group bacterium]